MSTSSRQIFLHQKSHGHPVCAESGTDISVDFPKKQPLLPSPYNSSCTSLYVFVPDFVGMGLFHGLLPWAVSMARFLSCEELLHE
jgi:hypothetical protein